MKTIALTKNHKILLGDKDFERVSQYKWHLHKVKTSLYAACEIGKKTILLHRFLLNNPTEEIDHIDGNGLNNTRKNLRLCSHKQNMQNKLIYKNNKSGFKGVSWDRLANKWRVTLGVNNKTIYLGIYEDVIKAADTYNKAALKYFGEFARVNKI